MILRTFPIKPEIEDQLERRQRHDIHTIYFHHSDEWDGHSGPFAPLAKEIKVDLAYLRNMASFQRVSIGAITLAYNFVLMEDGIVYQARPGLFVPASQLGDNFGGISVCLDGDFMKHGCTHAQFEAAKEIAVILLEHYPYITDIKGHCDVAKKYPNNPGYYATDCPGSYFYKHQLPIIREYALKEVGRHHA